MEGEEGIISAVAVAGVHSPDPSPPPPHDDRGSADPSDEAAELEVHSPGSDEEQDHDYEHDPDPDHATETSVSPDDLKLKIIKQAWSFFFQAFKSFFLKLLYASFVFLAFWLELDFCCLIQFGLWGWALAQR